jgi:hypothetical protein
MSASGGYVQSPMLTDIGTICYRLTMTIPPGRSQSIQRADSSISNASSTSI